MLVVALAACDQPASPELSTDEQASVSVCAAGPTVHGVDVSAEAVDWQAFDAGGWDFAIAKASEGVTFVEPQFATNWPAMKAAGVVRGAYCFFHSSPDDPATEADFFVDTVNQAGGFEPGDFAALDLETLDNDTPDVVAADALAWLQRVKADTGITPIIYTSPRVFDTLLDSPTGFADYPLWDVTWNGGPPSCANIPASWSGWAFWQYAGDSITAPGLPGSANDGDVFNGTRDDLTAARHVALRHAAHRRGPDRCRRRSRQPRRRRRLDRRLQRRRNGQRRLGDLGVAVRRRARAPVAHARAAVAEPRRSASNDVVDRLDARLGGQRDAERREDRHQGRAECAEVLDGVPDVDHAQRLRRPIARVVDASARSRRAGGLQAAHHLGVGLGVHVLRLEVYDERHALLIPQI